MENKSAKEEQVSGENERCPTCGATMVSLHEYVGGHGYCTFLACSDFDCRYGNKKPGIKKAA